MSEERPIILYVDDEASNRLVFDQTFSKRFPVLSVASPGEALEVLAARPVAVCVADQRMPEMTGNELLARVKDLYPHVVRIILTAYDSLDDILRAVNSGLVARYIVKPWRRIDLEQVLAWALEAHQLGQQSSELQLRLIEVERLVTLGTLGAGVLHDIGQPVSYLTTNVERLSQLAPSAPSLARLVEERGASLPDEHRRNLADLAEELPDVVDEMMHGVELIREIMTSMRELLAPRRPKERAEADPRPAIRYATSACRHAAVLARARVEYDGPEELPRVAVGSAALTQVLINLLSNAVQAVDGRPGGDGLVIVLARVEGGAVHLEVRDNGRGMAPDLLTHVGKPFFTTRSGGTGLGLAQVRRIIEGAGGDFMVDSVQGRGTTVRVSVPCA